MQHQKIRLILLTLGTISFGISTNLQAHGYVVNPPARGFLCKQGNNSGCGAIQWEPQSLEGLTGFPKQGPIDGHLASANLAQFGELDEQTSSRWYKSNLTAGSQKFTWNFTANHVTRNWRYYITKSGWNPNQKLTRSSFESTPFCTINGNLQRPKNPTIHTCNVPNRTGYQVILATWEIGDTDKSFYNVIDVMFKGNTPSSNLAWTVKGTIYPSTDLFAGDAVQTRVFDMQGERPEQNTRLAITNNQAGKAVNWAYQLATRINTEQPQLKAGQLAIDGSIKPVYGQNSIYAQNSSGISRVEIQIDKSPAPNANDFKVIGLKTSYPITKGTATIRYTLSVKGNLDISSYLYDSVGIAKTYAAISLNNASAQQSLKVLQAKPGTYQLVIKALDKTRGGLIQKTFRTKLIGAYDYVFPNGLKTYKAGTKVLQPKNGRIYVCRPAPNSGFCGQWSVTSSQFEPGIGSHWPDAWLLAH